MLDKINEFFNRLKNKDDSKRSKRSPFIIILCVLIIIIPTVLAFFYAYFYEDSSFLSSDKVEVELYGADGTLIASDKVTEANISDSPLVEIFYNMHITKAPTNDAALLSSPNFKAVIKQNDTSIAYNCHFKESGTPSYLENEKGNIFTIPEAQYNAFLNSYYSEPVYESALPAILLSGNGESVLPIRGEWHYRRQNGTAHTSTQLHTASVGEAYRMGGAINLFFDRHPEKCDIKVLDTSGATIYDGALDMLSFLTVEAGTVLNVKITATWEENPDVDYYGTLSYDFLTEITQRSEFSLSSTEIYPGQFVVISVTNVEDTSKILFSSRARAATGSEYANDSAINELYQFTPVFFKDGELARAILPFPYGLSEDIFSFSLSYGAAQQTFSVNILPSSEAEDTVIDKSTADLTSIVSDSAAASLAEIMKGIAPPSSPSVLLRGEFTLPSSLGFSKGYSFSDKVTYNDQGAYFIAKGDEYITSTVGGMTVSALNVGTVVERGNCDYLGNYVVIDHGLGLRTWYCWLSSVDVDKGDVLAKGEQLGKCGTDGLLSSRGVLIICSVYHTLIDPDFILGKEIKY